MTAPIKALPHVRDPLRNFVFDVSFVGSTAGTTSLARRFATLGFVSVSGQGITTEMIPYREGGDNTITRKLPGQSDVGPLQLIKGVFRKNPGTGQQADLSPQYEWFKRVFSVMWGNGTMPWGGEFRMDCVVRVMRHPTTYWQKGAQGDPNFRKTAGMMTHYFNCWPGQIQWNDLNAGDNSVMVETMTLHHEGFRVLYGQDATIAG